jgi:hypothetical protein
MNRIEFNVELQNAVHRLASNPSRIRYDEPRVYQQQVDYGKLIYDLRIENRSPRHVFEQLCRLIPPEDSRIQAIGVYIRRHRLETNVWFDDETPLMIAVRKGSVQLFSELTRAGADVNFGRGLAYPVNLVDASEQREMMLYLLITRNVDASKAGDRLSADAYQTLAWYVMHTQHESNDTLFRFLDRFDQTKLFVHQPWTPFELVCRLILLHPTEVYVERFYRLLPHRLSRKWNEGTALEHLMILYPWSPERRAFLLPLVEATIQRCTQSQLSRARRRAERAQDLDLLRMMATAPRRIISNRQRNREWRQRTKEWRRWLRAPMTPLPFRSPELWPKIDPERMYWRQLITW